MLYLQKHRTVSSSATLAHTGATGVAAFPVDIVSVQTVALVFSDNGIGGAVEVFGFVVKNYRSWMIIGATLVVIVTKVVTLHGSHRRLSKNTGFGTSSAGDALGRVDLPHMCA